MNAHQRKECFRVPGVDYTDQECDQMVLLLERLAACKRSGDRENARKLEQELQAAAVQVGHGAVGPTMRVDLRTRESGTQYAVVGYCRGDS